MGCITREVWETSSFTNDDGTVDWDVCEEGAGDMVCDLKGVRDAEVRANAISRVPQMINVLVAVLETLEDWGSGDGPLAHDIRDVLDGLVKL